MLGGGVISFASVLQNTVVQSTAEAELAALHAASREGVHSYLLNLLKKLGAHIDNFSSFTDFQSALSLSSEAIISSRTKHIATKFYLLRQLVDAATIIVESYPGSSATQ